MNVPNSGIRMDDAARSALLTLDNEALLRLCAQSFFIATGKGGQHRNKTQTAVRLTCERYGVTVQSVNRRSREENRSDALKKLRVALAYAVRAEAVFPPEFPAPSFSNPLRYPVFLARLLDVLFETAFDLTRTAEWCKCSYGQLVRTIRNDPALVQFVQQHGGLRHDA